MTDQINTQDNPKNYIGRFAPSPTGPLHLGSLYAALASFLHAKAQQGKWLLRIDDLDSYRNISGAADNIAETLQRYGLVWDGPVFYQSQHITNYQTIIEQLELNNLIYPCCCARKSLVNHPVYPKHCLNKHMPTDLACALRIKTANINLVFNDEFHGLQTHGLSQQHGDFIVKRKDHIIAYQLAVVVDDYYQQVSHVVRGFDLIDSTPKQIFLQQCLNYPTPQYCHIPVITDLQGNKLSKQTYAQPVSLESPENTLFNLLTLLKMNPSNDLKNATVKNIIQWGIDNWRPNQLKKICAIHQ